MQDNVFVQLICSIQYRVVKMNADDAYYELQNPQEQIQAYVFDGKNMSINIVPCFICLPLWLICEAYWPMTIFFYMCSCPCPCSQNDIGWAIWAEGWGCQSCLGRAWEGDFILFPCHWSDLWTQIVLSFLFSSMFRLDCFFLPSCYSLLFYFSV